MDELFSLADADAWYRRNIKNEKHRREFFGQRYISQMNGLGAVPKRILEIGFSSGVVLDTLQAAFSCDAYGLDPSEIAIEKGKKDFPRLSLHVGTADQLPFKDGMFDWIIFGFCLYLCDRKDLFQIAAEADRVLGANGFLSILDFDTQNIYRNTYSHNSTCFSHKMCNAAMFSWHPAYVQLAHQVLPPYTHPDERVSITTFAKVQYEQEAPLNPYRLEE